MIEYYNKVKENRTRFDEMVERTVCETDDEEAIKLATDAARFASLCGVGLLASSALERKLCSIAESIGDVPAQGRRVGGTCLVASELYLVGGHTKVLERVAAMLKDEGCLSLILTASVNRFVPDEIRDAVKPMLIALETLDKKVVSDMRNSLKMQSNDFSARWTAD